AHGGARAREGGGAERRRAQRGACHAHSRLLRGLRALPVLRAWAAHAPPGKQTLAPHGAPP
ncbi:MAG: hypothetical protein KBI41_08915, partial [Kiritimatiellae bacterium]|nr:hypothetical protein [Kiritimatiellia bacterium]